jgi:hypothetical protein
MPFAIPLTLLAGGAGLGLTLLAAADQGARAP